MYIYEYIYIYIYIYIYVYIYIYIYKLYKYGLIPRSISGYMDRGRAILPKAEGRGQCCSPEIG